MVDCRPVHVVLVAEAQGMLGLIGETCDLSTV